MLAIDRAHLVATLAARLTAKAGTWTPEGDTIRSQGTPQVLVTDLHDGEVTPNHIDIGVALSDEAPVLWDCAVGYGDTSEQVAETAAHMWVETTGSTMLELLTQQGELASHLPGDDPEGLPGFHTVHGPVLPFGGDSETLSRWVLDTPLLPPLRETLLPRLGEPLNGVKLLFGGLGGDAETVEVRVNGIAHDDVTDALRTLDFPRVAYAKTYLIVFPEVH